MTIGIAIVFFTMVFFVGWAASRVLFPAQFLSLPLYDRADWCSRINSTLHSFIVVPGFIVCMAATKWDNFWEVDDAQDSVTATRIIMCISMGYFFVDFFVIVWYRVSLWVVFVVHHLVASLPFYIHLFDVNCRFATFVLQGMLLVELANIFMNAQYWLDKAGQIGTKKYTVVFYTNYLVWIPSRLGIPVFMMAVIYKYIYFDEARFLPHNHNCLIPGMICVHIITAFCFVVFFAVLTPDVVRRLRNPEKEDEETKHLVMQRHASQLSRAASMSRRPSTGAHEPVSGAGSTVVTPHNIDDVKELVADTFREMREHDEGRTFTDGVTIPRQASLHAGTAFH